MQTRRVLSQIKALEHVFQDVHGRFLSDYPVDKALSISFRRNRQLGSRDRRFITRSIFGFYRWYGWIKNLPEAEISLKLLLGYLLDGNDVDNRARVWAESVESDPYRFDPGYFRKPLTLTDKATLFSRLFFPVTIHQLNPDYLPRWCIREMEAFQSRPPVWLRIARADTASLFSFFRSKKIVYTVQDGFPGTIAVHSPLNIQEIADFRNGWLEVQDLSSQAIGLICDPTPDSCWWDMCAGSGGKALHLSALMSRQGTVYATEVSKERLQALQHRIRRNKRWSNIIPVDWNGDQLPLFGGKLDGVLIDAPCSCSGTWRRNPDLRWRLTEKQVKDFSKLQLNLLLLGAKAVDSRGCLVYATCSMFEEENEQVIERFLNRQNGFSMVSIRNPFTGEQSDRGLNIRPPETDGNGMFVARFEREA